MKCGCRSVLACIGKLDGKERELAVEQLAILAGLRGLEVEVIEEARKFMSFVIDLTENKIFQNRYQRGLAEGEARGELKGELKVIRTQLTKRFGRLPAWARKRLDSATTEQLDSWSLKLLDAKTLEGVIGKR